MTDSARSPADEEPLGLDELDLGEEIGDGGTGTGPWPYLSEAGKRTTGEEQSGEHR